MPEQNALAGETSPYLLQHAQNPVHWLPWSAQALELARTLDRPILLSVGYSACHWCHVMAHESFEDEATAGLMNALFVNIKVDREERPDIDRIYQTAHQLLIRRAGGWPLTMFLTPDEQVPFFGGTYFPDQPRHGMPSFTDVLTRVSEYFHQHRDEIRSQRDAVIGALTSIEPAAMSTDALDDAPLSEARRQLGALWDQRHGGFGGAPKFPHPSNLERLLRHHAARRGEDADGRDALDMVITTMRAMSNGGLYDHLAGGFFRYSVDAEWMIPHFEKMLYDNGPLLQLAARCVQLTGEEAFAQVARDTAGWVIEEMQHPDGGYYSTLDADSEGEEGRYYVWTPDQARQLLDEHEFAIVAARFGLDRPANFESAHWHLHGCESLDEAARRAEIPESEARMVLDSARTRLLAARSERVRPGLDDKILSSWNGLMIKGMSVAGQVLDDDTLVTSATRALDFVRVRMVEHGRLQATWREGKARLNAYLDDHALLLDGVLSLLECRWRDVDFEFALFLADALLERFQDPLGGGFYFTSNDHERLISRPKPMSDDALPSGNGVAARVLGRMGHLLGETRYLRAAESAVRAGWESIARYPHAHNALLDALEEQLAAPITVVLRGDGAEFERWRRRAVHAYAPTRVTLAIPACTASLPGLLAERKPAASVIAYLCRGTRCDAPITDFAAFDALLSGDEVPRPE